MTQFVYVHKMVVNQGITKLANPERHQNGRLMQTQETNLIIRLRDLTGSSDRLGFSGIELSTRESLGTELI